MTGDDPRPARPRARRPSLRQYAVLHLAGWLAVLVTVLVLLWLGVRP